MVLRSLLVSLVLCASFGAAAQATVPSAIPRQTAPVADFKEVERLLAAGRLDQAVAVAEERLSQAPDSVVGRNLLGVIYNQQGKYDEAVAQFQQALAIAPNSADTLVNLAISYANQSKAELSAQTLRKALRRVRSACCSTRSRIRLRRQMVASAQLRPCQATNAAQELRRLGGARVILATAPNSKAMSDLIDGLGPNGTLLVVGATGDPIQVTPLQLINSVSPKPPGLGKRNPHRL